MARVMHDAGFMCRHEQSSTGETCRSTVEGEQCQDIPQGLVSGAQSGITIRCKTEAATVFL